VDVDGHEGQYAVSNHGRVLSYGSGILSPFSVSESGHRGVGIEQGSTEMVHRLVIEHHGPSAPTREHDIVNHIDGDPTNNHVDNLEWVTSRENVCHGALKEMVDRWGPSTVARRLKKWAPEVISALKSDAGRGRPRELDDEDLHQVAQLRKRGETLDDIASRFQVSRTTVTKRLEEYVEAQDIDLDSQADELDGRRRNFG